MLQIDFLGPEFLTWLYFYLDESDYDLVLGKRISLKPINGDDQKVTISTPRLYDSGEVLQAIKAGYYIETLSLEYTLDDRTHCFTLNASDGSFSGVTTKDAEKTTGDDLEADIILRMSNLDEVEDLISKVFKLFLERRLGQSFVSKEIKNMRENVLDGLKAKLAA